VVVDAEKKENEKNEREKLFQVKREMWSKELDRVNIVRDVRFRR
jgi:hypothetical protein